MIYVLYVLHILVCLFLIMVVLLQQGKGADLSVFGGGSTQTAFGARGAATLLHKLTVASFIVFILTTLGIAVIQGAGERGGSVMSGVEQEATEEPAEPAERTPAADEAAPETPQDGGDEAPSEGR